MRQNSNTSFSALLQQLAQDYYHHRLSFAEYRQQRREVLDRIDEYFNGASVAAMVSDVQGTQTPSATESCPLGDTQRFSLQEILEAQQKST